MRLNEHPARAPAGAPLRRIAIISDHASLLAQPGSIDCGGQNVYVANLARELGLAGYLVYGAPADRIRIAPCGFDPEELWPAPQHEARARPHRHFTV